GARYFARLCPVVYRKRGHQMRPERSDPRRSRHCRAFGPHAPPSSPTRWSRERPWSPASQHAPREVLRRHGLRKQGALHQIEAKLTGGEKVGPALHAIGDGACSHGISEIDDPPAGPLFAAVAVTSGEELSSDLQLDEGKIVKPPKRRPFRSEITDRDGDRAVSKQPGDLLHQSQVAHDVGRVDLDDESLESRMARYASVQMFDQFRIAKEGDWQIDRDFDVTVQSSEIAPIIDRLINHNLRHLRGRGITVRHDIAWRHDPQSRMTNGHERFGTAERQRAGIDLRLIREFERVDGRRLGRAQ